MRKIDYQHLADIIRQEVTDTRAALAAASTSADRLACRAALACASQIAAEFSARASVDRDKFLAACGIE